MAGVLALALSATFGFAPGPQPVPQGPIPADVFSRVAYVVVDLASNATIASHHEDWLDTPVEPGSIAKVATLSAALEAGVIDANSRIACSRQLVLPGGRAAPCSHPPLPRPPDVADALAHSCNTFVASVARRLSRDRLSAGHVAMGLPPVGTDEDLVTAGLGMGRARIPPRRLVESARTGRGRSGRHSRRARPGRRFGDGGGVRTRRP